MKINKLHHVNIRTNNLVNMIEWYTNVLGLSNGKRPDSDFKFNGAWMYLDDTAVVHLVKVDGNARVGSEVDLKLEHFAFSGSGLNEFETELQEKGEKYQRRDIPSINLV